MAEDIEIRLARLEVLVAGEVKALREARDLQAKEYERRLEMLNHEATQLKAMQSSYVPRETHELLVKEVNELRLWKSNDQGKNAVWGVVIPLIVSIIVSGIFLAVSLVTR